MTQMKSTTASHPRKRGSASADQPAASGGPTASSQSTRETVESILVAVILAFLFRAFVAEAFVIPTGSMAPTLQGRHVDVLCDECGYEYRTGASGENEGRGAQLVTETTCPVCRYTKELERTPPGTFFLAQGNEDSFNGDRILVSKFAYQLAEPQRWDVIVFKYPGNAKQNYIKRLVGLPGETITIRHGDVFVTQATAAGDAGDAGEEQIVRKPPHKAAAMLQLIDDTRHLSTTLHALGWPSRWGSESPVPDEQKWQVSNDGKEFRVQAGSEPSWLRYRQIIPSDAEWSYIQRTGRLPDPPRNTRGQLILDHYAYNDDSPSRRATSWVGDLAIEAVVDVESGEGELLLKLVEGGTHYDCRIDVASGEATLTIAQGSGEFLGLEGASTKTPMATTAIRGPGRYRLRFANLDDQLLLWINGKLIAFDHATTFRSPQDQRPRWSPEEPGDLAPLGIGGRNIRLHVDRLRVLRDIYYLALQPDHPHSDYAYYAEDIEEVALDPTRWDRSELFSARRKVTFVMGPDQFFPLGDNSPQSKDARLWSNGNAVEGYRDPDPWVERKYLIGKAVLIYWPHAWRPFWPNFAAMGLIR